MNLISISAIIISIISLSFSYLKHLRDERKNEFETQPIYSVIPIECPSHNVHLLQIENIGKGAAEDIKIKLEILGTDKVNTIREDIGTYPVHRLIIDIEKYLTSDKNIKLYLEYDGHNTRKHYSQSFTIETIKNEKKGSNGLIYEVIEVRNISNSYLTSSIRKNID